MMIKRILQIGLVFILMCSMVNVVQADKYDDTLQFYLSKSDLIVFGRIVGEVNGFNDEEGVFSYICEVEIVDVIVGNSELRGNSIKVNIVRFERDGMDRSPYIKEGAESLIFLRDVRPSIPAWETADVWFGVQRPRPWMMNSLKRLSEQKL